MPKKGGTWIVCRFKGRGELGKKEGVVFLRGVDTPMHTMKPSMYIIYNILLLYYIYYTALVIHYGFNLTTEVPSDRASWQRSKYIFLCIISKYFIIIFLWTNISVDCYPLQSCFIV